MIVRQLLVIVGCARALRVSRRGALAAGGGAVVGAAPLGARAVRPPDFVTKQPG